MKTKEFSISPILKKGALLTGALLLVGTGTVLFSQSLGKEEEIPVNRKARIVRTYTVEGYKKEREEVYLGRIRAPKEIELAFEVGGRVENLEVQNGVMVSAGTTLARLDSTRYALRLEAAREQYSYTSTELARTEKLHNSGSAAQSELDRRSNAATLARITMDSAQEDYNDTELKAPFSGRVARRLVERGSFVGSGEPVFVFQESGVAEIEIYQTEVQLNHLLSVLDKKTGRMEVLEGTASGTALVLKEYATSPDPLTGAYRVTLCLDGLVSSELLPGTPMRVKLTETLPQSAGVVVIPVDALVANNDSAHQVWILQEGKQIPVSRKVVVGHSGRNFVEITSGLAPGDRVVTSGANLLRENSLIMTKQES